MLSWRRHALTSLQTSASHARLLFSESHNGEGANGSKNRPHDAFPVPGYYEPCSENVNLRNAGDLKIGTLLMLSWRRHALTSLHASERVMRPERTRYMRTSVAERLRPILQCTST